MSPLSAPRITSYNVCYTKLLRVPDGQALARARQIAARIAANGPLAVRALVATLRETETLPEAEAFEIESYNFV